MKFEEEYKKLNKEQKEAVESIDGPVMVVAGPGTGKTQILALRIGNILKKTDTPPEAILCLTFTNSAVYAMRERLSEYIGLVGSKVNVSTFHSFGMRLIEEYYPLLDLPSEPRLLDETGAVMLADRILWDHDWKYLSPRGDISRYFHDLKSLISLLKRERMTPGDLLSLIEKEIRMIEGDEENISTRGESKGQLKKEAQKDIEGLERTKEAVRFYEMYEEEKKRRNVFDYDDVLENLVEITEKSEDAKAEIREKYLYVLVDEHQDSSGVQNEFLEKVWKETEKPNIFVVGDDRQLIYGFGGASLSYFENFKHAFGKAKLITLTENYRSGQAILDCSHELLKSSLTDEKLTAKNPDCDPVRLVEAEYPRDEIIRAAIDMKEKGIPLGECAILVPKNKQVRSAIEVLRDMGMPVAATDAMSLFSSPVFDSFRRIMKIVADPFDSVSISKSFFDKVSGVSPLEAHRYLREKKFSLTSDNLFENAWVRKLREAVEDSSGKGLYAVIQDIGAKFFLDEAKSHEELMESVEIVRTILHLALSRLEDDPRMTLPEFLEFLDRLESYGEHLPIAALSGEEGVKVLTLHSSKGLEFDYVWIAHMDERSLEGEKRSGFKLPERLVRKKTEDEIKRQLYVAITRAKRFCALSYSIYSYKGAEQRLSGIVADLAARTGMEKESSDDAEKKILLSDPLSYVKGERKDKKTLLPELEKIVAKEYEKRNVSVSLLNNFFECPWKWYFRNLLQLPEEKTESLEFGDAIHCSIDRILKKGGDPGKIVEEEVGKKGFWSGKGLEKATKEALKIVEKWAQKRLPEISKERENEKSVTIKDVDYPHLSIYGKIDLLEKGERVTDFKTGNVRKKSDIEKKDEEGRMSSYLRQLAMYAYLLKVPDTRLEFLEAKDDKESFYDRKIGEEEIKLLKKDIADYDRAIKSGEWTKRECHFNSYGKDTVCEYCKRAKIYV